MKRTLLSLLSVLLVGGTIEAAALPSIDSAPGHASMRIEPGHGSEEVFSHFSSECAEGRLTFIGTIRHGRHLRLTLIPGAEASSYIEAEGDGKYPWLLACDGDKKFLVEKEYGFGDGTSSFRLYTGRALAGVDYAAARPVGDGPVHASVDDETFAVKMAYDLSALGIDFVATNGASRFEGRVEKSSGACDTVSLRRTSLDAPEPGDADTRGFRVCSGRVMPTGGWLAMRGSSK